MGRRPFRIRDMVGKKYFVTPTKGRFDSENLNLGLNPCFILSVRIIACESHVKLELYYFFLVTNTIFGLSFRYFDLLKSP